MRCLWTSKVYGVRGSRADEDSVNGLYRRCSDATNADTVARKLVEKTVERKRAMVIMHEVDEV